MEGKGNKGKSCFEFRNKNPHNFIQKYVSPITCKAVKKIASYI